MDQKRRPIIWLHGEVKTPPLSASARLDAGFALRLIQEGVQVSMPLSRPLPNLGPRCQELRIRDGDSTWRIILRVDPDAVIIVEVFAKKSSAIPHHIISTCRARLKRYDDDTGGCHG